MFRLQELAASYVLILVISHSEVSYLTSSFISLLLKIQIIDSFAGRGRQVSESQDEDSSVVI